MILACAVFYIGNTIQITSFTYWYQLAIGRCICGVGVGALSGIYLHMTCTDLSPRSCVSIGNGT